jgi:hypothetical protein
LEVFEEHRNEKGYLSFKTKNEKSHYFITDSWAILYIKVLKQNCNIGNRKEIFPFLCCPKKLLSFFGEPQSYKK